MWQWQKIQEMLRFGKAKPMSVSKYEISEIAFDVGHFRYLHGKACRAFHCNAKALQVIPCSISNRHKYEIHMDNHF